MKESILGFCFLSLFSLVQLVPACAQEVEVPEEVLATFEEIFPTATNVNWEENDVLYIATFTIDDYSIKATFEENGDWVETNTEIEFKDLPAAAQEYIKAEFVVEQYYSITKLEVPEEVRYFAYFETDTEGVNLTFDEDGNLVHKEIEEN